MAAAAPAAPAVVDASAASGTTPNSAAAPATTKGSIAFSARLIGGVAEFDGLSVHAVTDRQSDSLNNFLKGSDVE